MEDLGKTSLTTKKEAQAHSLQEQRNYIPTPLFTVARNFRQLHYQLFHPVTCVVHILGQNNLLASETLSKGDHLALVCIPT